MIYNILSHNFLTNLNNLALIILIPLLCSILSIYLKGTKRLILNITGAVIIIINAVIILKKFTSGTLSKFVILKNIIPNVSLVLYPDTMSITFTFLICFLIIPAILYSHYYMKIHCDNNEKSISIFFAFFLLSITSVLGIALAANLWTMFIFYELLTICTYPLVTFDRKKINLDSGYTYIGFLMGSSITFLMPAIVILWHLKGTTLNFDHSLAISTESKMLYISLFLMIVYGCSKSALFPFSFWLPKAMTAPSPVSALLHAVAVVKAGVFSIIKITHYTFDISQYNINMLLIIISSFTILFSSISALHKKQIKSLLAYSTIGQLAYITITYACAGENSISIAFIYMILHSLAKITLFFTAGAIYIKTGYKYIKETKGLAKKMPITCVIFSLSSLAIIGIPPFATLWAKSMILSNSSSYIIIISITLAFSTTLSILYFLPIIYNFFWSQKQKFDKIDEVSWPMLSTYCITCVTLIILYLFPQNLSKIAMFLLK